MYQPHNISGLLIVYFIFCGAVLILVTALKVKFPGKLKAILLITGFLSMFLAICISSYDNFKLRQEIVNIPVGEITRLTLIKGGVHKEIMDSGDISKLMSQIQSVRDIPAHHSIPMDGFDVIFYFHGWKYDYGFARDSARPDEYWVFNKNINQQRTEQQGEIGRIQSADFGSLVDYLLVKK